MGFILIIFIVGFFVFFLAKSHNDKIARLREIEWKNSANYHNFLADETRDLNRYLSLSERKEFAEKCLQKATAQLGIDCNQYRKSTLEYLETLNKEFFV